MNDPQGMADLLKQSGIQGSVAIYPTAGNPTREDGRLAYPVSPKSFAAAAPGLLSMGARLLGGCCGTTPAHIAALAKRIRNCEAW
jgi:methionine synthase I (cobalamin-dependent)